MQNYFQTSVIIINYVFAFSFLSSWQTFILLSTQWFFIIKQDFCFVNTKLEQLNVRLFVCSLYWFCYYDVIHVLNGLESCQHHPGVPVFHDALKGWSCCKKRTTDFTDFLKIPVRKDYLWWIWNAWSVRYHIVKLKTPLWNQGKSM